MLLNTIAITRTPKKNESGKEVESFEKHASPSASKDSESEKEDTAPNRGKGRGRAVVVQEEVVMPMSGLTQPELK